MRATAEVIQLQKRKKPNSNAPPVGLTVDVIVMHWRWTK
jgi:hypothetical protein